MSREVLWTTGVREEDGEREADVEQVSVCAIRGIKLSAVEFAGLILGQMRDVVRNVASVHGDEHERVFVPSPADISSQGDEIAHVVNLEVRGSQTQGEWLGLVELRCDVSRVVLRDMLKVRPHIHRVLGTHPGSGYVGSRKDMSSFEWSSVCRQQTPFVHLLDLRNDRTFR